MLIKTFNIKNNPNLLGFVNYDKIPEEYIVEAVLQKLRGAVGVSVADTMQQLPYSYENRCTYNGAPFTVICDDTYGAILHAEDEKVLSELKCLLE